MKKSIRLKEEKFYGIIKECVKSVLMETTAQDAVLSLISQANEAYRNAYETQGGDETPLMDKEGNSYGLFSEIYLDGRGYIVFPFAKTAFGEHNGVEKIRVFAKKNGKILLFNGDYFTEGWKDAKKLLKQIVRDSEIGTKHFKGYNPDWENSETPEEKAANKTAIRNFNKEIGRKVSVGTEYA
ncbi:MAG: hypothetical protein J6X18_16165 [Bacteroidales bacterium]|nr:hypothetical protein [Bacteroidales bacterium]